jgi:tetratricopeptide (TPR) repeat protein
MRINGQRVATWSSQHGWSDDSGTTSMLSCFRVTPGWPPRGGQMPSLRYILRGRAAWNNPPARDNYVQVLSLFEHALALDPRSVDAHSWLAAVLAGRILNGMSDSAAADIKRADALAAQALSASPRSPLAHLAKGQVLRAQN